MSTPNATNSSDSLQNGIAPSPPKLPAGYSLRPLDSGDFDKGFLELLEQLTAVQPVSREQFKSRLEQLNQQQPKGYHIFVIENLSSSRIIGTATLVLEWKFIHGCGARGRIEDVVVDASERGKHFGRILNEYLVDLARHFGIYKLSLECTDELVSFYEQVGFHRDDNNFLVIRFDK